MRKLVLDRHQRVELARLDGRELSAFEFWKKVLGPPPANRLWVVDKTLDGFIVGTCHCKMKGTPLQHEEQLLAKKRVAFH